MVSHSSSIRQFFELEQSQLKERELLSSSLTLAKTIFAMDNSCDKMKIDRDAWGFVSTRLRNPTPTLPGMARTISSYIFHWV